METRRSFCQSLTALCCIGGSLRPSGSVAASNTDSAPGRDVEGCLGFSEGTGGVSCSAAPQIVTVEFGHLIGTNQAAILFLRRAIEKSTAVAGSDFNIVPAVKMYSDALSPNALAIPYSDQSWT